ncbi:cytidylyltransferase domain-containing protein [Helicobacter turcicus]|uniref:Acylneuraminate cytidylyltransferase family protein n=1 Tax=Helicobacter turcicus TaxID=2867412 RepID=A0ABS7JQ82_9HELI|nr:acylneuraminate cytidylyltransferase family protein [Helicobacter turcicus]MBX7491566.1 acylneuraminate cytidylyltransferase family protein [Helicobacter turcicus]MBX7546417.1 acylneuraminate cytidylyltransferase family protein [Helicobacter turcicus]
MLLAIIPARGGSKGIKRKNLALLNNKPLLYYTIKAAKEAKCVDEIVISSEDEEILQYAKSQNVIALKRPLEFAQDNSRSNEVLKHCLENFQNFEEFVLLQATSPLREALHIDAAYLKFKNDKTKALISVCAYDREILKAFVLNQEGFLKGICNDAFPFTPRQELPEVFMANGAIYLGKSENFLKNPSFLAEQTSYFLMDKKSSLDIDEIADLKRAEQILKEQEC